MFFKTLFKIPCPVSWKSWKKDGKKLKKGEKQQICHLNLSSQNRFFDPFFSWLIEESMVKFLKVGQKTVKNRVLTQKWKTHFFRVFKICKSALLCTFFSSDFWSLFWNAHQKVKTLKFCKILGRFCLSWVVKFDQILTFFGQNQGASIKTSKKRFKNWPQFLAQNLAKTWITFFRKNRRYSGIKTGSKNDHFLTTFGQKVEKKSVLVSLFSQKVTNFGHPGFWGSQNGSKMTQKMTFLLNYFIDDSWCFDG